MVKRRRAWQPSGSHLPVSVKFALTGGRTGRRGIRRPRLGVQRDTAPARAMRNQSILAYRGGSTQIRPSHPRRISEAASAGATVAVSDKVIGSCSGCIRRCAWASRCCSSTCRGFGDRDADLHAPIRWPARLPAVRQYPGQSKLHALRTRRPVIWHKLKQCSS